MLTIFSKEINTFFSSLIGYIAIGVFLLVTGLMMFVFPDTSLLDYNYATLDQLFSLAPMIFMFLIPAVTMRSFAEEIQTGTIELLTTRPLRDIEIVMGKYLANLALVLFALIPTFLYYYTVHQLGSPTGNLDSGAIQGSYIGLVLLAGVYTAIGVFASSLIDNPTDTIVQMFGIDHHYSSISRGVVDTRDIIYFISIIALFIAMTLVSLEKRKW